MIGQKNHMNKTKFLLLFSAVVLLLSALVSCNRQVPVQEDDPSKEQGEILLAETIEVTDVKGSGLTGDLKAAFRAENGRENRIIGEAQNPVCYAIYASFPSPTMITRIVLTVPSENQSGLASATVDASVDGRKWTTVKTLDEGLVAGKTYNLNVSNEKKYSYVRVRQSDAHRTELFIFRNMVIEGIAGEGPAGAIGKIEEEQDSSVLLTPQMLITSNAAFGNAEDVFSDNADSYTADYSDNGKSNYVIGTFNTLTEIRRITVKLWGSNRSARGTTIEVSNDGVNWDVLSIIPDLRENGVTAETGEFTYHVNPNETYGYIRIAQNSLLAPYEEWTLNTVLLYGVESDEKTDPFPRKFVDADTVKVTYYDSHVVNNNETVTPDIIWDTNDKTTSYTHQGQDSLTEREVFYIAGELETPTVITEVIYYSPTNNANRVRTSYFEASVDGETWIMIATLPGKSEAYAYNAQLNLVVNDDTEYRYIRLVQGENFYIYYWTVGTVEVKGVRKG